MRSVGIDIIGRVAKSLPAVAAKVQKVESETLLMIPSEHEVQDLD